MLNAVRAWILLSTLLVGAGWLLSALHELNRVGYLSVFALAVIAAVWRWRKSKWPSRETSHRAWHKFLQRFKRPAPLLFLALALVALAGGALYVPSNGDSNAYRIPRILHWLGQEQWHWIHTYDSRMNIGCCGSEWLSAPLILFTRTDRFLFLINWLSYLMLPGLIFSVFTRLRVRPRVAWWWAWLLPSGWCYAMQAGSVCNDSFAVVYALAAVDLALRAGASRRAGDLWLSLLAAALLTNTKQTNLPLVLLWVIAAWPGLKLLLKQPVVTAAVAAVSLLVSIAPVAIFNFEHQGTWTGIPGSGSNLNLDSPFWGIVGNAFCLPVQNLLPPIFPWVDSWNAMMEHFVKTPFGSHFASFESFGRVSFGAHGVSDGNAGIGLGICLLTVISLWAARRLSAAVGGARVGVGWQIRMLRWLPWFLLLLFMAKVGTYENARQLAPYYPFFFPLLLVGAGHVCLARRAWWQRFGLLIMLSTVMLLVVSRGRPLFPGQTILGWLHEKYPHSRLVSRALLSYTVRSSMFEGQRNYFARKLPPGERVVGFASTIGGSEVGLWLPFGQRRVEWVLAGDTPERLRRLGIHYVVVEDNALQPANETIEQWMSRYHGDLVDQVSFTIQPGRPQRHIYLVRLSYESAPG